MRTAAGTIAIILIALLCSTYSHAEKVKQPLLVDVKEENGKADDALLSYAKKHKGVICTNDKELKKRCLDEKVSIIFMRNKKTLEMKG